MTSAASRKRIVVRAGTLLSTPLFLMLTNCGGTNSDPGAVNSPDPVGDGTGPGENMPGGEIPPPRPVGSGGAVGSGGSGTGTGGSASAPLPVNCEYPEGPYAEIDTHGGRYVGRPFPPDVGWNGYDTEGNYGRISIQDLQDCDSSRGINAIVLKSSSIDCGVCTSVLDSWMVRFAPERPSGTSWTNDWYGKGVTAFALIPYALDGNIILEDEESMTALVHTYFEEYQPNGWGIVAEPSSLIYNTGAGLIPVTVVVDPRTMLIESIYQGGYWPGNERSSSPDGLEELLARNNP